jgi:hypothetical protein
MGAIRVIHRRLATRSPVTMLETVGWHGQAQRGHVLGGPTHARASGLGMPHVRRKNSCRNGTNTRPAVTMLETVACSAALLALLAMVTPALSEYRRQSKEVRCISNLQRIAGASAAHAAADPNELLTPVHSLIGTAGALGAYEWGGKSGRGESLGGGIGPDIINSKWGTQFGRGPGTRGLNDVLYKGGFADYAHTPGPEARNWVNDARLDLDVYRCPSDYGYTGIHTTAWRDSRLSSFDHYGNSYAVATHWVGVVGGNCDLMSSSPFLRPVSEVPSPARTLSYTENCGKYSWRQNYGPDGCGSLSGTLGPDVESIVRGWHGSPFTFTTAFVDGHVGRTSMRGFLQPVPNIGQFPDVPGVGANYDSWRCAIIRGSDWQLDTLPAAPVLTAIPCFNSGAVVTTVE